MPTLPTGINSFFGYKAVTKISLKQVPYLKIKEDKPKLRHTDIIINEQDKILLKETTSSISSKKLKKALLNLGKSILKSEKN